MKNSPAAVTVEFEESSSSTFTLCQPGDKGCGVTTSNLQKPSSSVFVSYVIPSHTNFNLAWGSVFTMKSRSIEKVFLRNPCLNFLLGKELNFKTWPKIKNF